MFSRRRSQLLTPADSSGRGASNPGGSSAEWVFERSQPMGGASGEAFTNTTLSSGMHPAAVLARESIQNAVDARDRTAEKALVVFRIVSLHGPAKLAFIETAKLSSITDRRQHLNLPTLNWLTNRGVPLSLAFVEDYHTTGLEGDPHHSASPFHRLLLSVGDGSRAHEHNTGGSFGFGKSAFSSNSDIRTIFAYTRFREHGRSRTRLFGCGYFQRHQVLSAEYNGRAWFGTDRTTPDGMQIVDPFEDDAADALAAQLGFKLRTDDSQIGTTVLIVASTELDADDLKKAVEEWWWPRIVENRLDVKVISPNEATQVPRPRTRPDLQPFIDAYEIAIGTNPTPAARREARRPLNRMGDLELGVLGLKVLDVPQEGQTHPVPWDRLDSVALIRSPGMVVRYERRWPQGTPFLVGSFVASEQIDDALKLSESSVHDRWDDMSPRLRVLDDTHRRAVRRILDRIGWNVRNFRRDASPPTPPRTRRLFTLEREMAKIFVGRGPKEPIEHPSAPVHLTYAQNPEAIPTNDGRLRVRAELLVRLKEDADIQEARLRLRLKCVVLEDGAEGDGLDYHLRSDAPELVRDETDPDSYVFPIGQDAPVKFTITTDPYDPLWTVRLRPDIEPVAGDSEQVSANVPQIASAAQ